MPKSLECPFCGCAEHPDADLPCMTMRPRQAVAALPDITDEDIASVSTLMQENGLGCHDEDSEYFRRIVAATWAYAQGAKPIPADQILKPGQCAIGIYEMQILRDFAARRMSQREHDRLEACRDAHEAELRAQQAKGE